MSIRIEKNGRRLYLVGDTYAAKDRIKGLGGKWDADRRAWWIGSAKAAEVEALVAELSSATPAAPKPEDASDVRLIGKARYKGRSYYVRWAGRTKKGTYAMRLVSLPKDDGTFLDFWADGLDPSAQLSDVQCSRAREQQAEADGLAVLVKTYPVREYRGRTEYTTLGSIAAFLRRQADPSTARGECTECGEWGPRGETCRECHEGTHV